LVALRAAKLKSPRINYGTRGEFTCHGEASEKLHDQKTYIVLCHSGDLCSRSVNNGGSVVAGGAGADNGAGQC
jgi:hypothetical protein